MRRTARRTRPCTPHAPDAQRRILFLVSDASFEEEGYVVIEGAIGPDTIARLRAELSPYLQGQLMGRNDFEGYRSERVYALLAKAPAVAELIEHAAVLEAAGRFLHPSYLLSAALVVNLHPGETPQGYHQDDALGAPPPPRAPQGVSTIWALDEFTDQNGATQVIPGSHRWERVPGPEEWSELEPLGRTLLLRAGSVAIFPGTLYHRSGANRSQRKRLGLTIQYCQPWLRQLENLMLATPPELAARYSTRIQELVGYSLVAGTFVGYVDGRHPRKLIPELGSPSRKQ
jgi:ectoine hydroxylase-related dioxygenase (phytanoyl-CoA dioxygenase family)